jgi:hypothetical protein
LFGNEKDRNAIRCKNRERLIRQGGEKSIGAGIDLFFLKFWDDFKTDSMNLFSACRRGFAMSDVEKMGEGPWRPGISLAPDRRE